MVNAYRGPYFPANLTSSLGEQYRYRMKYTSSEEEKLLLNIAFNNNILFALGVIPPISPDDFKKIIYQFGCMVRDLYNILGGDWSATFYLLLHMCSLAEKHPDFNETEAKEQLKSCLKTLVLQGFSLDTPFPYRTETPLGAAARNDLSYVCHALVDLGVPVDSIENPATDRTALHDVARAGKEKTVIKLLKLGADVNRQANGLYGNNQTPLHEAVFSSKTLKVLLKSGADVNAKNGDDVFSGESALCIAAKAGKSKACAILLKYGANETAEEYKNLYNEIFSQVIFHTHLAQNEKCLLQSWNKTANAIRKYIKTIYCLIGGGRPDLKKVIIPPALSNHEITNYLSKKKQERLQLELEKIRTIAEQIKNDDQVASFKEIVRQLNQANKKLVMKIQQLVDSL